MLRSATRELQAAGIEEDSIEVAWVPGSFELALVARRFALRREIEAVLCMGLIIKGETTHDHWVAADATQGLMQVMLETDTPVLFGVLTCNDLEQARARALAPDEGARLTGEKVDYLDKGRELARAALESLAALEQASSVSSRTVGLPGGGEA